ncbi:hypothetical protein [Rhodoblastus sp.]
MIFARLSQIVDMTRPLGKLAAAIDRSFLEWRLAAARPAHERCSPA